MLLNAMLVIIPTSRSLLLGLDGTSRSSSVCLVPKAVSLALTNKPARHVHLDTYLICMATVFLAAAVPNNFMTQ